jgi:hypothetical protein
MVTEAKTGFLKQKSGNRWEIFHHTSANGCRKPSALLMLAGHGSKHSVFNSPRPKLNPEVLKIVQRPIREMMEKRE